LFLQTREENYRTLEKLQNYRKTTEHHLVVIALGDCKSNKWGMNGLKKNAWIGYSRDIKRRNKS